MKRRSNYHLEKQHQFKAWNSVIVLLAITLFLAFLGYKYGTASEKARQSDDLRKQIHLLEQNQRSSEKYNDELQKQIDNLKKQNEELQKKVSLPIKDKIIAKINDVFKEKATEALAVAQCESGIRDNALNVNKNGTRDHSVFQINDFWAKVYGEDFKVDWKANIVTAKKIYDRNGNWQAWYASNPCHHLLASR